MKWSENVVNMIYADLHVFIRHSTWRHAQTNATALRHSMFERRANDRQLTCYIPQMLINNLCAFYFRVRVFVSLFRMNFWREVIKMVLYPPSVRISFFFFSFFVSLTAPFLCSQFGLDAVLCFIIHRIRSHHLKLPASEEKKKKKSQQRKETFLHLSSKKFSLLSAGA